MFYEFYARTVIGGKWLCVVVKPPHEAEALGSRTGGHTPAIGRPRETKQEVRQIDSRDMALHPEILKKNGKRKFVILPYEEFLAVQERLADADDLLELRKAKRAEGKRPSIPLAEVKGILAGESSPAVVREKPAKKYGK